MLRGPVATPLRRAVIVTAALALYVALGPVTRSAEIVVEEKVTYTKVGDVELQLDIARPDGDGPFPAIVFIHGGGWQGGNRSAYRVVIDDAARHGYVAATVSYRLTQPDKDGKAKFPFPAQIHDVKCAVRWLRANAKKYKVDIDHIGATGGSAGGHLSLLLGVTDASAKLEGEGFTDQSSRVQAVVNVFGPTDMAQLFKTSPQTHKLCNTFLEGTPDETPENYKAASPLMYVSKDDPPVLTLHGAADTLVPPDQAERLDKAMKEASVPHTLVLYEGEGHGFKPQTNVKAGLAMYEFFDRHLKAK